MKSNLKTIYEYLCDYTETEIDDMIYDLSLEEKILIRDRYGDDLHNPVKMDSFDREKSKKYYGTLVPKMRKLLYERKIKSLNDRLNSNSESEIKSKLLELVSQRKTNNEICDTLDIDRQTLYKLLLELRNNGTMIARKYYSDGSIVYKPVSTFNDLKKLSILEQDRTIITEPKENIVRVLAFSDLHFGNELERRDLVERAFDYCIKNNINLIFAGGDLIDGTFSKGVQTIGDPSKQIEYFIEYYPYDKSILTFSVGGDHDASIFQKKSLNIAEACNNHRHDVIIGGFNNSGINIKNDQVLLYHHIEGGMLRNTNANLILHGHSHKYIASIVNGILSITLPSLSDINQSMPTVLELNLYFKKGYINDVNIKQIYLGEQDILLGEVAFELGSNKNVDSDLIANTETYKRSKQEDKQMTMKLQQPLSAVEKFNKRYGVN